MRLAGRCQAAIEVLDDVERHHLPVAEALKNWGLSHRFAGSGDRAAIGTLVYDALRCRASISWRMDAATPTALAYGALFDIMERPENIPSLMAELAADKFAPRPLDDACLKAWQVRDLRNAPDDIQADIPAWSVNFFKNLYGEDWLIQAQALSTRPPLDLRQNRLKISHKKLANALHKDKAQPISWFKSAWRIQPTSGFSRHPNIQAGAAFQKGWFEIQDLGSQIVTHLANAKAARQVLDYCTGGGGKTLALAADMENRGQIYAYDSDRSRLAPIFVRLKRASVRNVQVLENLSDLDRLKDRMDLVLIDAPCSGSGTWRRHPDAKWRLREAQLQRRVEEQRHILERACRFVRSGGWLVYITCSLFEAENDHQIGQFLEKNTNFHAINMRPLWFELMSSQAPLPHFGSMGLYLSPVSTDSDGFYIAVLQHC